jgi:hypothetical protein
MEANLIIKFEKINNFTVNEKLLSDNPSLKGLTEKTVLILCKQIEKYFKDKNINVKTEFQIK